MKYHQSKNTSEQELLDNSASGLKAIVRIKGLDGTMWKDVAEVTAASRSGASFILTRECSVGQLVTLVLPLDKQLRAYDLNKELYPVMCIVQQCFRVSDGGGDQFFYSVGFVGKRVPASFKDDPQQDYRITGMGDNGLWKIVESNGPFKIRKSPRYWVSLSVVITTIRKDRSSDVSEEITITMDIGANGVAVYCSLDLAVDEKVKFACKDYDFYSIARVRNRRSNGASPTTIHLEFVDSRFPIEKLVIPEPRFDEVPSTSNQDNIATEFLEPSEFDDVIEDKTAGQFEFSRYEQ